VKAPSTKTQGTVLALASVLIVVALVDPRAPTTTPLPADASQPPVEAGPPTPAVQSSPRHPVDLARQAAVPVTPPEQVLADAGPSVLRCEFWCELSVALDRLMEANQAMQAAKGAEVEFRQRQRDYVVAAEQLDGLRGERDDAASAATLLRDEVWERAAVRSRSTHAARSQVPVDLSEPAPDLVHPLQRHDSDPPDAVVVAFRRHFLAAFHAMPVANRRAMLGNEPTPRERAVTSRIQPDATWLFRQCVETRFHPLRDSGTLAER
jgi:hypothetical protein